MKKTVLSILFVLCSMLTFAQNPIELDTLTKTFKYEGEVLYVKNGFVDNEGFSVKQVLVNKKKIEADVDHSAFEVKLKENGIDEGEMVRIDLLYVSGGKPVFLGKARKE